ncbi:UDP-glucose glycoprotein:glucosyltransferase, putative [Entamoeba invadens IP1]|uniref:UDP-glucose glycoprotein:glucosyltransferase, putative n=1 Tax=Entamoeba invadens IP1 TaxID=370355 RepID=UPI0002C3F79D|nr:UDP-glucose glycoprotein:glucosyltransferase, putative [Entamoeba invadens IP1]ELP85245.1 UDP-glucose glycoprotein:glucosyltransferase, putative [Entamoeba invadens IP1]|eukprot:XP_004184591.1 UDP-glucose glycoprotein:glucosyltransferase, putative [Entamoeba invadens IP1]
MFLLVCAALFLGTIAKVEVSVRTPWKDVPVIYEVISYVHKTTPTHFKDFFDQIIASQVFSQSGQTAYDTIISIASKYVNKNILERSLALHSEMLFVVSSDNMNVTLDGLLVGDKHFAAKSPLESKLLYLIKSDESLPNAVIVIPDSKIKNTVEEAYSKVSKKEVGSVAIYLSPSKIHTIDRMNTSEVIKDGIVTPLDNMNFTGFTAEMMHRSFKREFGIVQDKEDYIYLKEWDQDKLRAAVVKLLKSNTTLVGENLRKIIANFPLEIVDLLKTNADGIANDFAEMRMMQDQSLSINNIDFELSTKSVYDLLELLRTEDAAIRDLALLKLPQEMYTKSVQYYNNKGVMRFKIPSDIITFVNSFENRIYERNPKNLESFFQYNPYRIFRFTAKDLYTFVATLDFSGDDGMEKALKQLNIVNTIMLRYMIPFHFGVVPVSLPETQGAQLLFTAFYDVNRKWGTDGLMRFVEILGDQNIKTAQDMENVIKNFYRGRVATFTEKFENILKDEKVENKVSYMNKNGFDSSAFFINGMFITPKNIYMEMGKVYQKDLRQLENLISSKQLDENRSIYLQLLYHFDWINTFDKKLLVLEESSLGDSTETTLTLSQEELKMMKHVISVCKAKTETDQINLIKKLSDLNLNNEYLIQANLVDEKDEQKFIELFKNKRYEEAAHLVHSSASKVRNENCDFVYDGIKVVGKEHLNEQIKIIQKLYNSLHDYLLREVGIKKLELATTLVLKDSLKNKRTTNNMYSMVVTSKMARERKLSVTLFIDPIMREAQKAAEYLSIIEDLFPNQVSIDINFIKTPGRGGDFPSEFYISKTLTKPIIRNGVRVDENLEIKGLPSGRNYQLKIETPQCVDTILELATCDIDNIKFLRNTTEHVEYKIRGIVAEGFFSNSIYDGNEKKYFYLTAKGDYGNSVQGAVSKEGYFQLLTPPGSYSLHLENSDVSKFVIKQSKFDTTSFLFAPLRLEVFKEPLLPSERVAQPTQNSVNSKFSSFSSFFGGKNDEQIEIFTIAGGADYERTVKILMYSVKHKTSHPLRFWLVEDFLSPSGRKTLPEYAEKIGVKLNYVRFHWPYFMFKQVSKTRLIWAYKMFFNDLMFPQNIHRIIFMDSDQVTRADAFELWSYDMKNYAIAMTPFCVGEWLNKETESYRFWYQESWKNALNGRPYHISALFIIDFDNFRRDDVGTVYREIYNNLTPDPNNLANLDQDLPNYVQGRVPILSLPQEWLWCESWCNKGVKSRAKTIDLCNNPIHPMSKIQSALMNIEEWKDIDETISGMMKNSEKKEL